MAEKPKQNTKRLPRNPWRSMRERFRGADLRRGPNHTWLFPGQQSGENVLMVVRKHWWFLFRGSWPLLLSILALIVITIIAVSLPNLVTVWIVMEVIAFVLV